jgi:hypothetical protein
MPEADGQHQNVQDVYEPVLNIFKPPNRRSNRIKLDKTGWSYQKSVREAIRLDHPVLSSFIRFDMRFAGLKMFNTEPVRINASQVHETTRNYDFRQLNANRYPLDSL